MVLIGEGGVAVRDDESALTSATLASGVNFTERKIADSAGVIYQVRKAIVVGKTTAWWRDMGTSQQNYYLELERTRPTGLDSIKRLVLDQVESPHSVWNGDAKAAARVRGFSSVTELIAECRKSWDWTTSPGRR